MSSDPKETNGQPNPSFNQNDEVGHNHNGYNINSDTTTIDKTSSEIPSAPKMIYEKGEQRRMLRNIIVTSCSFTLLFTAFQSMSNLQTSFNPTV